MPGKEELTEFIRTGNTDGLAAVLQQQPDLANLKTDQGISFLTLAAYYRNQTAVDLFKHHKASIDLFEGSAINDFDVVKEKLEKQPDLLNSYSIDGFTSLGLACFFGNFAIANYLIEQGADVNKASNNQFKVAPIHSACAISNYDIVEVLILHGANVNAKQQEDVTPLHEAAHNGQTKLVQLLIDSGADVNAKTEKGQTPLAMAEEKNFEETAALIRKNGGV